MNELIPGSDHNCAMEPAQFKWLSQNVEEIQKLLGGGKKGTTGQEIEIRNMLSEAVSVTD